MRINQLINHILRFLTQKRYILTILMLFGVTMFASIASTFTVAVVAMNSADTQVDDGMTSNFNWNSEQRGIILSAFYYGFIVTQVAGGLLSKRFGAHHVFGSSIVVASILMLFTPQVAGNMYALICLRAVEGLFLGLTFPSLMSLMSKWAPPMERSRMIIIANAGNYYGPVIALPLSGYLCDTIGWQSIFYVFGTAGIVWYIVWIIVASACPEQDTSISEIERNYITNSMGEQSRDTSQVKIPWIQILTSIPVWAIITANFTLSWGAYTLAINMPQFLADTIKLQMSLTGLYSCLPALATGLLSPPAGYLADMLQEKKILSTMQVRKYFTCIAFILQSGFLIAAIYLKSPIWSITALVIGDGLSSFALSGFGVNYLDIAPQFAGILVGLTNTFGTIAGIICPIITGFVVRDKGECFKCDSNSIESSTGSACGNMGYYADKSTGRGQLYLKTREEEPFCAHQYQVRVHSAHHDLPLRTLGKLQVTLMSEGGLTEKFLITEKDDDELFAGQIVSQIIVPHPALGFPKNISLLYTEYKGWLTRGLKTWSINKFVMKDSFGNTYSICKHMILESQVPVQLSLSTGDCKIIDDSDEQTDEIENNERNNTDTDTTTVTSEDTTTLIATSTDKIQRSDTNDLNSYFANKEDENNSLPWLPIIPPHIENSSKRTKLREPVVTATGKRHANKTKKYEAAIEPLVILKPKRESSPYKFEPVNKIELKVENRTHKRAGDKRSFEILPTPNAIKNVTKPSKPTKAIENETTDSKSIMVQLFPYRIASMFEKAERYARMTILPYLTEQFPTFFKTNIELFDSDNDTNSIVDDSRTVVDTYEVTKPEKRAFTTTPIRRMDKIDDYLKAYRNLSGIKDVFDSSDSNETETTFNVRKVDLPTFKPTKRIPTIRPKVYIPLERQPEQEQS